MINSHKQHFCMSYQKSFAFLSNLFTKNSRKKKTNHTSSKCKFMSKQIYKKKWASEKQNPF